MHAKIKAPKKKKRDVRAFYFSKETVTYLPKLRNINLSKCYYVLHIFKFGLGAFLAAVFPHPFHILISFVYWAFSNALVAKRFNTFRVIDRTVGKQTIMLESGMYFR